jgi:hypothetical protein
MPLIRQAARALLNSWTPALQQLGQAAPELTRQMGTERRPGLSGAWKQSEDRHLAAVAHGLQQGYIHQAEHAAACCMQSTGTSTRSTGRATPHTRMRPRPSARVRTRPAALVWPHQHAWLLAISMPCLRSAVVLPQGSPCVPVPAVLDDSASVLFLTEIIRGMAYTLGGFFDKKVTVRARSGLRLTQPL